MTFRLLLCLLLPVVASAQRGPCGFVREDGEGVIRWHTPYGTSRQFGGEGRIDLVKRQPIGSQPEYTLLLTTAGETFEAAAEGVKLTLAGGQTLTWPRERLNAVASRLTSNWVYSASVPLDEAQLHALQRTPIVGFSLMNFQANVPERYARKVQEYAGCLNRLE